MQTHSFVKRFLRAYNVASIVVKPGIALLFGVVFSIAILGFHSASAYAQSVPDCPGNQDTYLIQKGDTLSKIAGRHQTTWEALASANHIANPNLIYAGSTMCIVRGASGNEIASTVVSSQPSDTNSISITSNTRSQAGSADVPSIDNSSASVGAGNDFPYGQCTWWANERYHQLHGAYVPWMTNSDAWLWTIRAQQFGWQVSSTPRVGDIINLQANVQGASWLGHVAVVEKVLSNGDVIASNMNWGAMPQQVTDVEFTPGPGVTFIHQ